MITFRAWLKDQEERTDAVGSLAKWVATYRDVPKGHAKFLTWHRFLTDRDAHDRLEHLEDAWWEYDESEEPERK